jgi:PAS domain S-box-containing protein
MGTDEKVSDGRMTELQQSRSERKQVEVALRASEEWQRTILQTAMDGFWMADPQGRLLEVNETYCRMSGYSEQELLAMRIPDLEITESADDTAAHIRKLMAQGEERFESRHRRKDGSFFYVEVSVQYRPKDGGRFVAFLRDITERKRVENALKESEEKFRTIFDRASDGILIADAQNKKFLQGNATICSMLGYTKEEIKSLTINDIHPPKDMSHVLDEFEKQIKGEKVLAEDMPVLKKDGSIFYADIGSAPIDIGGIHYLVGIFRDITERRRAKETLMQREEELSIKSRNLEEVNTALKVLLKQREEDRSEMEENVLTNVKTSILPYIEKLKEGPLTCHQRACLEILEVQIKKIISPFLRRVSQACFDLTPQEIRVADFVKNGETTKEIAGILGISMKTVDYHRDNIRKKLGIKNHQTNLRSFLLKLS